jgi:hypothetical protein
MTHVFVAPHPDDVALLRRADREPAAPYAARSERKIMGLTLYENQLDRLFGGRDQMGDAVRGFGTKVAALGGLPGFAGRYWASSKL